MIKLLYLNNRDLNPCLTTCPMEKLQFRNPGYSSNCDAQWFPVKTKFLSDFSLAYLLSKEIKDVPVPQGNEIYEIIFNAEGVKYNYYDRL